jgi:ATP-binding cassette subfamily E protein 1
LFLKKIKAAFLSPQFQTDVYRPLKLDDFIDQEVQNLSGGELQRVAIVLALGMPADIYLIDEPSAYLDSEQRIIAARVIKRFIMHAKKTAFVVEHDFIMATYLADRVIVFDGEPGINSRANPPESLLSGCNKFLKNLDVTFRRDPNTYRPRINKHNSQMDQEQKLGGNYVCHPSPSLYFVLTRYSSSSKTLPPPNLVETEGEPKNQQLPPHPPPSKKGEVGLTSDRSAAPGGCGGTGLADEDGCAEDDDDEDILGA